MSDQKIENASTTALRTKRRATDDQGFWVRGSGLVYVPKDRANEISKVIEEHHRLEAERFTPILLRKWGY